MASALVLMVPFDVLASLGMDIYLPVLTDMPGALGSSPATVQLTLSLYLLTLGVGQLIFGPLADVHGRRPVLLLGGATYALSALGLALCAHGPTFVVLRVAQGLGASAGMVATFATVRDVYGGRAESTVVYGTMGAVLAFVPALGPIVGAGIALALGWRAIFVVLSVLAGLATVHASLAWAETSPLARSSGALRTVLGDAAFWRFTLGFSAALGSFFVFFSTSPRILVERLGMSREAFSMCFASVALVMLLASRMAPRLVARWGLAGTLARAMMVLLAGALLFALGQRCDTWWSLIAPMAWTATGIALACAVTADGALASLGHVAGLAVALYFAIQSVIVAGLGTLVVTLLPGDTAWPLVAWCAGAPSVVLLALGTRWHRR